MVAVAVVPLVPRELCRLSGAFANGGRGALGGSVRACWMCVYMGGGGVCVHDVRAELGAEFLVLGATQFLLK